MATQVTTIDLLRHGEPEGGNGFRGHSDFVLTPLGWQQMRDATAIRPAPWQAIVTSPLKRCAQFASALADELGLCTHVEPGLREMSFGDWEGVSFDVVRARWPDLLKQFSRNPAAATPPNGESLQQLMDRVLPAWHDVVERHRGQHVLLVAHGGVNRVILGHVLAMDDTALTRLQVPYAGLSRVQIFHHEKHPPWMQLTFMNGKA
jgi:alpha-ribazole phosphatase